MVTGADAIGIPLVFTFKGREYKLSRKLTQEMEQTLCDWAFHRAMDRLERQRELRRQNAQLGMSEMQYQRAMDRLLDNHAAGRFEWEGDLLISALSQMPGDKMVALLRFQKFDPTVSMDLMDEIYRSAEDVNRLGRLINPTQAGGEETKEKEAPAPPANP